MGIKETFLDGVEAVGSAVLDAANDIKHMADELIRKTAKIAAQGRFLLTGDTLAAYICSNGRFRETDKPCIFRPPIVSANT